MKRMTASLIVASSLFALPGLGIAQSGSMNTKDMPMQHMKGMPMEKSMAAVHKTTGIVQKLNMAKSTVTIAHEAVNSLNWPAMTMGFQVANKKLLSNIKLGQKVSFEFKETSQGKYTVIRLQSIK